MIEVHTRVHGTASVQHRRSHGVHTVATNVGIGDLIDASAGERY
ncbi:hypothetical protein [Glutamicibacter sp. M10]|nr:hypothetical protein [Glutamicibacter sp. M10]UXN31485.1 hypothetical protein N6V40_14180 [Glutamicibacter sp. M10]